ncbi:MAG: hypothetical protein ACRDNM_06210 [Gaiellaceae bacterium]
MPRSSYRCTRRRPHGPHTHTISGVEFACPGLRRAAGPSRVPQHACAGGCGARVFREHTFCDRCTKQSAAVPAQESIRATLRRRKGQCVVCGGPFPDGSGCEFCPKVEAS